MRRSVRLALPALAVAASGSIALAADHREAPLIREDPSADLNDVFAFLSPADPNRLALIMTVNPFSAPPENVTYHFSPNVRYAFHIDCDGDAIAEHTIQFQFRKRQLLTQQYAVRFAGEPPLFLAEVTEPTEEPEPNPPVINTGPDGIVSFAGQMDDPFFFDVVGFARFLAGTGGFTGTNGFAGVNVSAIAIELPLSLLCGATEPLQVWATTERRELTVRLSSEGQLETSMGPWQQIDRMGNPAVNTALIPGGSKDKYNIGHPSDDADDFAGQIVASLEGLGTNAENIAILASVAVPDTLKLDPLAPIGYPNGRDLDDDVVDTLLFFIFNQMSVPDGVDANDRPFAATFPYLASPHQPR